MSEPPGQRGSQNPEFYRGRYQPFLGSSDAIMKMPLWRYMTFEKFCWLLEKSELYHTRLDRFEDPFEGSVTYAFARTRKPEGHTPWDPWTVKSLRVRMFAACWHASECESDALWKLYAPGGAGIAVISSVERMLRSVTIPPGTYGMLSQVEYVDFETHRMRHRPFGTWMRPGFLKRKSFEHEREVRGIIQTELIVQGQSARFDDELLEKQRRDQPVGINAQVDLKGLIESIVVSPLASPFVEELVRITTQRCGLDHLVKKSELTKEPVH